ARAGARGSRARVERVAQPAKPGQPGARLPAAAGLPRALRRADRAGAPLAVRALRRERGRVAGRRALSPGPRAWGLPPGQPPVWAAGKPAAGHRRRLADGEL